MDVIIGNDMKRRYIIVLITFFSVYFGGCETDMMDYEGKPGIYFKMQKVPPSGYGEQERYEYVDTTNIPFGMLTVKDTVQPLCVRVMGDLVDYDRYFTIRVVDTLSTAKAGEDYETFETTRVVKAGVRDVNVPCRIMWTEKLMRNPDTTIYLTVRLEESEDFALPLKAWYPVGSIYGEASKAINPIVHVIAISDQIVLPKRWTVNYFGNFSSTKIKLMCQILGLAVDDFNSIEFMTLDRQKALAQNFDKYLKEEHAAGRTVMDKDSAGREFEMTMGSGI